MIRRTNNKLTLEQRISRYRGRKSESRLTDNNHYDLFDCRDELKARLRRAGLDYSVADVSIDDEDENVVVEVDWGYSKAKVLYYIMPTARGYLVEDDFGDNMNFRTIEGVALYIAEEYTQAMKHDSQREF